MKYQDAQKLQIVDIMELQGYRPARVYNDPKQGEQRIYNSPFREDKNPSFVVTVERNLFFDRGTNQGGNVKNYLALCSGSHRDDIQSGLKWADYFLGSHKTNLFNTPAKKISPTSTKKNEKLANIETLTFIEEKPLFYYPLKNYISQERGINIPLASQYLKEIVFKNNKNGNRYTAAGFKGGQAWAVRNRQFKGVVGQNFDITIIEKGTTDILLFSGFFDFLTYLQVKKISTPTKTAIILNTDHFIKRAIEYISSKNIQKVDFFKDNDQSGETCLAKLSDTKAIILDKSDIYKNYNDLNEWYIKNYSKS